MGGMIEYAANGDKAQGYLARPETGGLARGIIVLQEYWGLTPHIQDVCERFAALGYTALAPDLWDGKITKDPDEAFRMLMALDIEKTSKRLSGAVAALHAHGATGKLAAIGFCMGGQLALFAGTTLPEHIAAVVDFYGVHPKVAPDYAKLGGPVLAIFAENDGFIPVEKAHQLKAAVEAAGGTIDLQVYPAGHAFFNDARPEAYDPKSAADAWERVKAFLTLHLTVA